MTLEKYWDLRKRGSTTLLAPVDAPPVTPGADNYSFGVAMALQCLTGGALTVKVLDGTSRTVTLVDGGMFECPTIACTAFAGTGLFAYTPGS